MERVENIGRRIGRYELLEEIGRGGMAVVYRALDTSLERHVALKLMHPHLASHGEARERFQREGRAVARLKHPAVLEIYDYADAEGQEIYIVMELVEGTTLRRFLDEQCGEPLSAEAAALIMRRVGTALAHAHENGVVHRDVKPENILIGPKGALKLSDFGIAHMAGTSQMTVTGQILGSPAYMSPEHIERAELDARADIFSAGTVLYETSVGRQPFAGPNPHAVIKRIVDGDYDDPLRINPAVGYPVARIIRRCLRIDPEERYASAAILVDELDTALRSSGIEPSDGELETFFADPQGWQRAHAAEVLSRTFAQGVAARRARRHPEAMDHFNRVLAIDPGNERALTAVAGMHRRRRLGRIAQRSALLAPLIVAVACAAWLIARGLFGGDAGRGASHSSRPARGEAAGESDGGGAALSDGGLIASKATAETASRTAPRSLVPRLRQKREVVFTPQPLGVEIVIDGRERFPFGPANRKRVLTVGRHSITFVPNDPKRFVEETWQVTIPPGEEPFPMRERLRWRPARILVRCNAEALVTVPGRAADRANRPFDVPLEKGPSEQVSVLVSMDGYVPLTKQVTISAGELAEVPVHLTRRAGQPASP